MIFDVDGTLVDSTYHHALAWQRAFRACDVTIPMWRIHRQIGKGGDRLVGDLAGEEVERDRGDEIRAVQRERFLELIGEVQPLDGAHELLLACKEAGWRVALASSGRPDEVEYYLHLLDVDGLPDVVLSSADVDTTKPAPDLLTIAHERAGGEARQVRHSSSATRCGIARPPARPGCGPSACCVAASPVVSCWRPARRRSSPR